MVSGLGFGGNERWRSSEMGVDIPLPFPLSAAGLVVVQDGPVWKTKQNLLSVQTLDHTSAVIISVGLTHTHSSVKPPLTPTLNRTSPTQQKKVLVLHR